MMRVLTISGPGVATNDECYPHGHVRLEACDGDHGGERCHVATHLQGGERRLHVRPREGRAERGWSHESTMYTASIHRHVPLLIPHRRSAHRSLLYGRVHCDH
jgi:hypothetical protein